MAGHPKPPERLRRPLRVVLLVAAVLVIAYAASTIGDFDRLAAAVIAVLAGAVLP